MTKFNCTGCFFAGVKDGYRPECNCKRKEEIIELEQEAKGLSVYDDIDISFPEEEDNFSIKDRSAANHRRRHKSKVAKKNLKTLSIVCAKSNRLSDKAFDEEVSAINKKLSSAYNSAKFRHQTTLSLVFPEIPKRTYGRHVQHIISTFRSWIAYTEEECLRASVDDSRKKRLKDLANTCEKAIQQLEKVASYDGEVLGLHREENTLHVTVGFRDKVSLSNFKGRLAS